MRVAFGAGGGRQRGSLAHGSRSCRQRPLKMQSAVASFRAVMKPTAAASTATNVSVSKRMSELKKAKKTAFIPFLCAGDPDIKTTEAALRYLNDISADVIELGVPYSDPLADGPVIHGAATRALAKGTTLDDVLKMAKNVTPDITCPLVLFAYYNPIRARGLELFCKQIKEAGVSGLLVPDLPLELTHDVRTACEKEGIELVLLAAPTSSKERMKEIARHTQGFVYLVSVTGVTGMRSQMSSRVQELIQMLHDCTDKSVAVGFGVSSGEQAKQLQSWGAEGVIVGSALVRALHEGGLSQMQEVAKSIKDAIA